MKPEYVALFLFICCSAPKTNDCSIEDETIPAVENQFILKDNSTPVNLTNLAGQIFEVGSKADFTDSCSFYFECDCCYGHLVFNPDSTFYNQDVCVADLAMTIGKYSFANNTLTLEYSGRYISQIYNWDHETDTTLNEYSYTDTTIQPFVKKYLAYSCNAKIAFEGQESANEIILQIKNDYSKMFFLWENENILGKLNKK